MKKYLAICLAAVLALSLAACAGPAAAGTDAAGFRIGIIQLTEHPALDAAREGFVDALVEAGFSKDNIDVQNAQSAIEESLNGAQSSSGDEYGQH